MNAHDDLEDEKPLDPAMERVRVKMVRLLAVGVGIMMIGVMAVLGAVVYKVSSRSQASASRAVESWGIAQGFSGRVGLPAGSQLVSADLDGERILLMLLHGDGRQEMLVYSLADDRIVARVAIE